MLKAIGDAVITPRRKGGSECDEPPVKELVVAVSKGKKTIMGGSVAATAAACVLALATSAAGSDGSVQFENDYTRDCLAIPDSSLANGVGAIQWTCNTNYDQQWIIENHDHGNTGQFTLKNRWSGKCLAIPHGTTTNGVQAIQWTCNGGSEQLWIHDSIGRLRNVASDRCLAVPNGSWKDGTEVIQWTCTTNTDQRWNALV
ncbi:RICIN domain-containing protein [Streptomyces sp. NPDC001816]|uniref:RICIN domain-containing protein n=1 Tax=Streptomyces sp. NPDC001816 TaxID=3364612 RepID=UPI0036900D41